MLEFRVQSNNVDATILAARPGGTSTGPPILLFLKEKNIGCDLNLPVKCVRVARKLHAA